MVERDRPIALVEMVTRELRLGRSFAFIKHVGIGSSDRLTIRTLVPDVYGSRDLYGNTADVEIIFSTEIPPGIDDRDAALRFVREAIHAAVLHELDEQMLFHGVREFDPHQPAAHPRKV